MGGVYHNKLVSVARDSSRGLDEYFILEYPSPPDNKKMAGSAFLEMPFCMGWSK